MIRHSPATLTVATTLSLLLSTCAALRPPTLLGLPLHLLREPASQQLSAPGAVSRRALLSSALVGVALPLPAPALLPPAAAAADPLGYRPLSSVKVGRGVLVTVEEQYPTAFAAYLSRFLINYEPTTRRWWDARLSEAEAFTMDDEVQGVVGMLGEQRRDAFLAQTFGSLVTSVEVGLAAYTGESGASKLGAELAGKYTTNSQKRALAQLLSLIEPPCQPRGLIASLIGEVDSSRVRSISLESAGGGFTEAPPLVTVEPPPSDKGGRAAKARAVMRTTGRWRSARVLDGGGGYAEGEVPEVEIGPPPTAGGVTATAVAIMRDGKVEQLQIVDMGRGYLFEPPTVRIDPPARLAEFEMSRNGRGAGARTARAELLPEFEISAIEVVDGGSGYNADEPPGVTVGAPPVGEAAGRQPAALRGLGKGGSGEGGSGEGGSGEGSSRAGEGSRARAQAVLTPRGQGISATEIDALRRTLAEAARARSNVYLGPATPPASRSGLPLPRVPARDRSDPGRAQLLPPTVVPQRKPSGVYRLPLPIPAGAFGVRAEVPVQRLNPLLPATAAKIFLAGGLCSTTAHSFLVPLDVVKTRMQTAPSTYGGPVDCARRLLAEEGASAFAQGLGATVVGYLVAGSLSFGLLEVHRPQPPAHSPSPTASRPQPPAHTHPPQTHAAPLMTLHKEPPPLCPPRTQPHTRRVFASGCAI